MNAAAFIPFLRWWLRQLVNARLRPMFCRWKAAERAGDVAQAERFELLFLKLLNYTDCYPFCVEVGPGLYVCDEPSSDDWGMEDDL